MGVFNDRIGLIFRYSTLKIPPRAVYFLCVLDRRWSIKFSAMWMF